MTDFSVEMLNKRGFHLQNRDEENKAMFQKECFVL